MAGPHINRRACFLFRADVRQTERITTVGNPSLAIAVAGNIAAAIARRDAVIFDRPRARRHVAGRAAIRVRIIAGQRAWPENPVPPINPKPPNESNLCNDASASATPGTQFWSFDVSPPHKNSSQKKDGPPAECKLMKGGRFIQDNPGARKSCAASRQADYRVSRARYIVQ